MYWGSTEGDILIKLYNRSVVLFYDVLYTADTAAEGGDILFN
jgi:hypothetical protein